MATNLVLAAIALVVFGVGYRIWARPKDELIVRLPQVSVSRGYISSLRIKIKNTFGDLTSVMEEGYEKVCIHIPSQNNSLSSSVSDNDNSY